MTGRKPPPTLEKVERLADALGLAPAEREAFLARAREGRTKPESREYLRSLEEAMTQLMEIFGVAPEDRAAIRGGQFDLLVDRVRAAFAAHTRGGWRAVGQDQHGVLRPGAPATFAIWHTPAGLDGTLPVLYADDPQEWRNDPTPLPVCRRTVLRGRTIFDEEGAVP